MILLLLRVIRATRVGNWKLHLLSAIPWFFCYDHVSYSRYLVNRARNYGGIRSVTGNFVLKINNYNCRGFKSFMEDIKTLCRSSDIFAIQEHWLNRAE